MLPQHLNSELQRHVCKPATLQPSHHVPTALRAGGANNAFGCLNEPQGAGDKRKGHEVVNRLAVGRAVFKVRQIS